MSHGGSNSCFETLYYGKFFIGFPHMGDQVGNSYRLEYLGVGISQKKSPDANQIINILNEVKLPNNKFSNNAKRIQRILEFEELRAGRDLAQQMVQAIKLQEFGGKSA